MPPSIFISSEPSEKILNADLITPKARAIGPSAEKKVLIGLINSSRKAPALRNGAVIVLIILPNTLGPSPAMNIFLNGFTTSSMTPSNGNMNGAFTTLKNLITLEPIAPSADSNPLRG